MRGATSYVISAAAPKHFIYGLPSNECHRMLQDRLGYIGIVTDRGLDFAVQRLRPAVKRLEVTVREFCQFF